MDYLIVSVIPNGRAILNCSSRIDNKTFEQWRRNRDYPFLPVAAFPTDRGSLSVVDERLAVLPAEIDIRGAVELFHSMPIVQEWQKTITHHLNKQGADSSVALLLDWRRAVNAKGVVAT